MRRSVTVAMVVAASLAGSVFYRRRAARRLERVELYAGDGTMVSLLEGSEDFDRVLSLARDVLSVPG
jgi:hypothetical protein